jgi:hypothetical protein
MLRAAASAFGRLTKADANPVVTWQTQFDPVPHLASPRLAVSTLARVAPRPRRSQ